MSDMDFREITDDVVETVEVIDTPDEEKKDEYDKVCFL